MDFKDQIKQLGDRIAKILPQIRRGSNQNVPHPTPSDVVQACSKPGLIQGYRSSLPFSSTRRQWYRKEKRKSTYSISKDNKVSVYKVEKPYAISQLSSKLVRVHQDKQILSVIHAIGQNRPTLFSEGYSDPVILDEAWNKLYDTEIPFEICFRSFASDVVSSVDESHFKALKPIIDFILSHCK